MPVGSLRNPLIEKHLPLVQAIARKVKKTLTAAIDYEDLVGYGSKGLVEAAERFDPTQGVTFSTFAYYRIRGAILDSLRGDPERQRVGARPDLVAVAPSRHARAANDNGRVYRPDEPTTERLSWLLSESAAVHLTSLDEIGSLPDEAAPHPDEEVERHRLAERVATALSALPEIERRVVELHYYEELSFSEIGAKLGICKPWAFRLHNKALRQLKEKLAELNDDDVAA